MVLTGSHMLIWEGKIYTRLKRKKDGVMMVLEKDYLRSVHVWPPLEGCYKHTDLCIVKNLDTEEDDFDFGNGETDYEIYADQSVSIVIVVRLQMWGLRHLNRKRMYRRIRRELAVGMMSHVRLGVRALQGVHEMVTMVAKYMY